MNEGELAINTGKSVIYRNLEMKWMKQCSETFLRSSYLNPLSIIPEFEQEGSTVFFMKVLILRQNNIKE